jgi:hypothetical protein
MRPAGCEFSHLVGRGISRPPKNRTKPQDIMNFKLNAFPSLLRPYSAIDARADKPLRRSPTLSRRELRRLIAQMVD